MYLQYKKLFRLLLFTIALIWMSHLCIWSEQLTKNIVVVFEAEPNLHYSQTQVDCNRNECAMVCIKVIGGVNRPLWLRAFIWSTKIRLVFVRSHSLSLNVEESIGIIICTYCEWWLRVCRMQIEDWLRSSSDSYVLYSVWMQNKEREFGLRQIHYILYTID